MGFEYMVNIIGLVNGIWIPFIATILMNNDDKLEDIKSSRNWVYGEWEVLLDWSNRNHESLFCEKTINKEDEQKSIVKSKISGTACLGAYHQCKCHGKYEQLAKKCPSKAVSAHARVTKWWYVTNLLYQPIETYPLAIKHGNGQFHHLELRFLLKPQVWFGLFQPRLIPGSSIKRFHE